MHVYDNHPRYKYPMIQTLRMHMFIPNIKNIGKNW